MTAEQYFSPDPLRDARISRAELMLFIDAIRQHCGYNLSQYASNSLRRLVKTLTNGEGVTGVADLIEMLRCNPQFRYRVMDYLTVSYSQLFRDPLFFLQLKQAVFPFLESYPRLSIWVAGCANGEEAYSMAIALQEAGLLQKSQIYATDISHSALQHARSGMLLNSLNQEAATRYHKSGGQADLSEYFDSSQHGEKLKQGLLGKISFEHHDLTQQHGFISPQLVLCRNVLIYFKIELQNKVFSLLSESVVEGGFLAIDPEGNSSLYHDYKQFEILSLKAGLLRKKNLLVSTAP